MHVQITSPDWWTKSWIIATTVLAYVMPLFVSTAISTRSWQSYFPYSSASTITKAYQNTTTVYNATTQYKEQTFSYIHETFLGLNEKKERTFQF